MNTSSRITKPCEVYSPGDGSFRFTAVNARGESVPAKITDVIDLYWRLYEPFGYLIGYLNGELVMYKPYKQRPADLAIEINGKPYRYEDGELFLVVNGENRIPIVNLSLLKAVKFYLKNHLSISPVEDDLLYAHKKKNKIGFKEKN